MMREWLLVIALSVTRLYLHAVSNVLKHQPATRTCLATLWHVFGTAGLLGFDLAALVADGVVQTAVKPRPLLAVVVFDSSHSFVV